MRGAALGPAYPADEIQAFLDTNEIPYRQLTGNEKAVWLAQKLAEEKVVGHFQGRMEFGPRALGRRSILADARSRKMQSYLNLSTKFRESFRPFAPIVLAEEVSEWFEFTGDSPYMLMTAKVREDKRSACEGKPDDLDLTRWVNQPRSIIPAVTHVDFSARLQTVDEERNPELHDLLSAFRQLTGCPVLVNTSFNVRSEPIVCTPADAYACFMRTGIDILMLEDFILEKTAQPEWKETTDWREEFGLD